MIFITREIIQIYRLLTGGVLNLKILKEIKIKIEKEFTLAPNKLKGD